ncbi:uncharacterized protein LOC107465982 [Arachis duranensis]|uniref:Uncharacterized protein LOC107465982 n=1 Tax=Arachis duranensis TaxID=130453 RepID=A0A6P4C221_ARADU|nr:uncharacterized protein LOC107465982 [Arachis duranensis]
MASTHPWHTPVDDKEVTIPWGGWVHEKPPAKCRSRDRAVVEAARPSPSTASTPSSSTTPSSAAAHVPPPPAPEPTYLLVQRLFRFMEHSKRQLIRRLDRIDQDQEEEDVEEPTQQDTPPETHVTTEPQLVPQTQPEPEPTGVPLPDPQD